MGKILLQELRLLFTNAIGARLNHSFTYIFVSFNELRYLFCNIHNSGPRKTHSDSSSQPYIHDKEVTDDERQVFRLGKGYYTGWFMFEEIRHLGFFNNLFLWEIWALVVEEWYTSSRSPLSPTAEDPLIIMLTRLVTHCCGTILCHDFNQCRFLITLAETKFPSWS